MARPKLSTEASRAKLLWKLGHRSGSRRHRYFGYRMVAFVVVHFLIAVVPLSGLMRFDFWRGNHMLFGQTTDLLTVIRDFAIPFGLFNVGIVVVVRWTGRYLCGWGCPVNFMNRYADWLRGLFSTKKGRLSWKGHLAALAASLALAGIFLTWFVDYAVFTEGSASAVRNALIGWASLAAISYGQVALLSWKTCRSYCPSGIYFSVLGRETKTGIEQRPDGSPCASCNLCVTVCPMEIEPRDLVGTTRDASGFYFPTPNSTALCIRCGDCVEACDRFFEKKGGPSTLRLGFLKGIGSALPPS